MFYNEVLSSTLPTWSMVHVRNLPGIYLRFTPYSSPSIAVLAANLAAADHTHCRRKRISDGRQNLDKLRPES